MHFELKSRIACRTTEHRDFLREDNTFASVYGQLPVRGYPRCGQQYGRDPDGKLFDLQEVTRSGLALDLNNVVPELETLVIK